MEEQIISVKSPTSLGKTSLMKDHPAIRALHEAEARTIIPVVQFAYYDRAETRAARLAASRAARKQRMALVR